MFLPSGLVLMTSCGETYRLAGWRALAADQLEYREDDRVTPVQIVASTSGELTLRLDLGNGEWRDEHFRAAIAPTVCPDSRPSP